MSITSITCYSRKLANLSFIILDVISLYLKLGFSEKYIKYMFKNIYLTFLMKNKLDLLQGIIKTKICFTVS